MNEDLRRPTNNDDYGKDESNDELWNTYCGMNTLTIMLNDYDTRIRNT